jgi:transcriptional regulator with XRE-family HTH domain
MIGGMTSLLGQPARLLGQRLREARLRLGLNQDDMGEMFGIGRTSWAKWEQGKIPVTRFLEIRERLNLDEQLLPVKEHQAWEEMSASTLLLRQSRALAEASAANAEVSRRWSNGTLNPQVTVEGVPSVINQPQKPLHTHHDSDATPIVSTMRRRTEPDQPKRVNGVD